MFFALLPPPKKKKKSIAVLLPGTEKDLHVDLGPQSFSRQLMTEMVGLIVKNRYFIPFITMKSILSQTLEKFCKKRVHGK